MLRFLHKGKKLKQTSICHLHPEIMITATGNTIFHMPPVIVSTKTSPMYGSGWCAAVLYEPPHTHEELTAALRFSLPLCLAGCCCFLLNFVFVLFLFLITSGILEQDWVHLIEVILLLSTQSTAIVCILMNMSFSRLTCILKTFTHTQNRKS